MEDDGRDRDELLSLYQLSVEMADRVSARRGTSNAFFLTVQTALVAFMGLNFSTSADTSPTGLVVVALAGILLSVTWWLQLRSYRDLNRAKFEVIHRLEEGLVAKPFSDEWTSLKQDPIKGLRGRYAELGVSERLVPGVFACLYIALIVAGVWP